MTMKRRPAGRPDVTQQYAGGRSPGASRGAHVPLAIIVPLLVAVAAVGLVLVAMHPGGGKLALTAKSGTAKTTPTRQRLILPMPPAGPPPGTDCRLGVPPDPLTAQGLATPYRLSGGGCSQARSDTEAFVQATIINPATGKLSVYDPLVVTAGTQPAVAPVVPTLPKGAIVTVDIGYNGDTLTLVGENGSDALQQGKCVKGTPGSIFGQVSYCNGPAFFHAANKAIAAGMLTIPAAGTASDGQPCPTTRSFTMVDQDPNDNVTTTYLLTASGQTAQSNAANTAQLTGATLVGNGSDHALLDRFIDPALGCTPMTARDLSNPGSRGTSQALDELLAAADQQAPIALVPVNDPMTEVNGHFSIGKTNLYRAGFGQPRMRLGTKPADNARFFCRQMLKVQTASLQRDQDTFTAAPAADPAVGNNLFTFLAARLSGSFDNMSCGKLGMTNPVQLTLDQNGVATGATFGVASPSPSPSASSSSSPSPSASP